MNVHKWQPKNFISPTESSEAYACIILNRPIHFEPHIFQCLWNNGKSHSVILFDAFSLIIIFNRSTAKCRVLVDGGANRWFDYVAKYNLLDAIEPPSFCTGDMDSITDESIERLNQMNCKRILTPDQNETDCTKSVFTMKPFLIADNVSYY